MNCPRCQSNVCLHAAEREEKVFRLLVAAWGRDNYAQEHPEAVAQRAVQCVDAAYKEIDKDKP